MTFSVRELANEIAPRNLPGVRTYVDELMRNRCNAAVYRVAVTDLPFNDPEFKPNRVKPYSRNS